MNIDLAGIYPLLAMSTETCINLLKERSLTIAVAESCTGGLLAATLTEYSGASSYFLGGVITYANQQKIDLLHVHESSLDLYGAVSEETAREMVLGLQTLIPSDIGVSITGIAGPEGGSLEKAVGTVYIGYRYHDTVAIHLHRFQGNRSEIRRAIVDQVFEQISGHFK